MLCSSKTNNRPDKQLKHRLITLAYTLVALTVSLIMFLFYPEYFLQLMGTTVILGISALVLTIKTINAGEEAMSYGGFANEIIRHDFQIKRIDNALGEAVLQNEPAKDLFKNLPVLAFIESRLSDTPADKAAFYRLQTACNNLSTETVTLSLNLHREENKIFNREEWFKLNVRPIFLKKADIFNGPFSIKAIKKDTYLFWSIENITAEQNMSRIFQEERKSLHDFLDYLPIGLYIINRNQEIEYANHAFARLLGESREKINGRSIKSFLATNSEIPFDFPHWNGKAFFRIPDNQTAETLVFQDRFKDEDTLKARGVVVSGLPGDDETKNSLGSAMDKISWLFNFAPVGILFLTPAGRINDCNARACGFLGSNTEKADISGSSIFDYITEEDTSGIHKSFDEITENKSRLCCIDVHLKTEEKIATVYISPMKKFHSNDDRHIDGYVVYMIDATKQKSLEIQFAQAQKMQAVGQLAGGVAHDFNNLLTAMIGFCDLLLQRHGVGDPSFADLIQIKQNANRAAGLVRQLLAFSRKQPLKPKLIDVTENFTELSNMLKRILGEQIILKFRHGTDLGYIRVDPVQFSQVIINLAVNAKDAMKGSGTLNIATRTEVMNEPYQFGSDIVKPGEFVVIDVKDTGCGIPKENLDRIFEPFFSTKQNVVGSGTGLGLAMVYGIVRQTEGFIKVESTLGKGTTFSIHLPRFESGIEPENKLSDGESEALTKDGAPILKVQEKISSPVNINEKMIFGLNLSTIDRRETTSAKDASATRILFVEDEDSVRTFGIRALKKKGYNVIGCNSAENALECLETDSDFDLLITDMVMPGKSGAELANEISRRIPGIKIILASGYSEEITKRELSNSENFEFMAKPYSLGDLTAKVFDVLNKEEK